jgi:uncharacterized membrane protein
MALFFHHLITIDPLGLLSDTNSNRHQIKASNQQIFLNNICRYMSTFYFPKWNSGEVYVGFWFT